MSQSNILLKFIFLCCLCTHSSSAQNCAVEFSDNKQDINYNSEVFEKTLQFSKYQAFFIGENHSVFFEPQLKFHFIKQLHESQGIRDVFMEFGFSTAYFFNRFLELGDTTIMSDNYLPYRWYNFRDFWLNLYEYNKNLPENQKIIIHGVDFERTEIFNMLLLCRKENARIPANLLNTYALIENLAKDDSLECWDKKFSKRFSKIRRKLLKNSDMLKGIYGDNFQVVHNALSNKSPVGNYIDKRNNCWFLNMEKIFAGNKIDKFIAFFGRAHTSYANQSSPTVRLSKCDFFRGRILNIATIYHQFVSAGMPDDRIIDFLPGERSIFNDYYNKDCRANLIKASEIDAGIYGKDLMEEAVSSDYILFIKEFSGN